MLAILEFNELMIGVTFAQKSTWVIQTSWNCSLVSDKAALTEAYCKPCQISKMERFLKKAPS